MQIKRAVKTISKRKDAEKDKRIDKNRHEIAPDRQKELQAKGRTQMFEGTEPVLNQTVGIQTAIWIPLPYTALMQDT